MPPKLTPLHAKFTKVVCRYCGPEEPGVSRQSNKIHLELIHGDTSGNLRVHGVTDISSMFVRREPEREKAVTAVQTE